MTAAADPRQALGPAPPTGAVVAACGPKANRATILAAHESALARGLPLAVSWIGGDVDPGVIVRYLSDLVFRLTGRPPGEVRVSVRRGRAAHFLVQTAREEHAELVVLGRGERRRPAGALAVRVARQIDCPVLVTHPDAPSSGRVLVATDMQETAALLGAAAIETRRCGGPAIAVHVVERRGDRDELGDPRWASPGGDASRFLECTLESEMKWRGINGSAMVAVGDTLAAILALVERHEVQVVAVGTGRHGASSLMVGGLAVKLLRSAPCSVLVVPSARKGGR